MERGEGGGGGSPGLDPSLIITQLLIPGLQATLLPVQLGFPDRSVSRERGLALLYSSFPMGFVLCLHSSNSCA